MKAKVKEIDKEKDSVLLADDDGAEKWFGLADQVKMEYVRLGDAEVTVDQENDLVTYLKMNTPKKSGFNKPAQNSFLGKPAKPEEEKKYYKTKHLVFDNLTTEELRVALDLASEHNWVIATQTHFVDGKWNAVVYYKVK